MKACWVKNLDLDQTKDFYKIIQVWEFWNIIIVNVVNINRKLKKYWLLFVLYLRSKEV